MAQPDQANIFVFVVLGLRIFCGPSAACRSIVTHTSRGNTNSESFIVVVPFEGGVCKFWEGEPLETVCK